MLAPTVNRVVNLPCGLGEERTTPRPRGGMGLRGAAGMANARGGFDGVQGSSSACDDASRAFDDATSVRSVSWAPSPVPRPRDDRCRRRARSEGGKPRAPPPLRCGVCAGPVASGYRHVLACCVRAVCRGCRGAVRGGHVCGCGVAHPLPDAEIVARLEAHAARGHAAATTRLGVAAGRGHFGLRPDAARAASFFDAAAALGDAAAQYNLGLAYLSGDGVRLNKSRAAKCFRDAADQDFPPGLHNRGMCYAFGTGVPKDHARAIELITRAAALGEPNAAFALGQCYRTGTFGVAADARKARACFGRAAALGHPDAAALVAGDDGAA